MLLCGYGFCVGIVSMRIDSELLTLGCSLDQGFWKYLQENNNNNNNIYQVLALSHSFSQQCYEVCLIIFSVLWIRKVRHPQSPPKWAVYSSQGKGCWNQEVLYKHQTQLLDSWNCPWNLASWGTPYPLPLAGTLQIQPKPYHTTVLGIRWVVLPPSESGRLD